VSKILYIQKLLIQIYFKINQHITVVIINSHQIKHKNNNCKIVYYHSELHHCGFKEKVVRYQKRIFKEYWSNLSEL